MAMTSFAVIFALIITVPLGIFITRNKVLSGAATGIANVMQSIYPLYGPAGTGHPLPRRGQDTFLFMVFVYAFLPILKNTYTGISSISPSMEIARDIGLTQMQQINLVELPMTMPSLC